MAKGCHFLLAAGTPWKPNYCHSLPVTTTDSGKAGKPPIVEFFWSPTVCSLRAENIVLPRSGKQQWPSVWPIHILVCPLQLSVKALVSSCFTGQKLHSASSSLFLAFHQLGCRNWELLFTGIILQWQEAKDSLSHHQFPKAFSYPQ